MTAPFGSPPGGGDEAATVALAALPGMGAARLTAVLGCWAPEAAWDAVLAQRAHVDPRVAATCGSNPSAVGAAWARAARLLDVPRLWEAHRRLGVAVVWRGGAGYPAGLDDDPEPPAVFFVLGSLDEVLARPAVAIVGTRRCTHYGRAVAGELAADLARSGVTVVSGLALGIDGAAHRGALSARAAPPLAVVGSGLDVVYPRRHADLWRDVARAGAVVSEAPLGAAPEPWRFPARNRIIAALAEVVVVVESHEAGGSMHTVRAALERDRTVMAVPGPVRSSASRGTNRLLADGSAPACDATDVLVALGLSGRVPPGRAGPDPAPSDDPSTRAVLDALGWEAATLDQLAERLGEPLGPVAVLLTRLEHDGWVARRGTWWERSR